MTLLGKRIRKYALRALRIHNAIRIFAKRAFFGSDISADGKLYLSRNTRLAILDGGTMRLGKNMTTDGRVSLYVGKDAHLTVGDSVYMNENTMISCLGRVSIGEGTLFGPGVKVFDNDHFFGPDGVALNCKAGEITIGRKCWLASNVVVLKNSNIGDHCVIGAGCVVKGDIPANTILKCRQEQIQIPIDPQRTEKN